MVNYFILSYHISLLSAPQSLRLRLCYLVSSIPSLICEFVDPSRIVSTVSISMYDSLVVVVVTVFLLTFPSSLAFSSSVFHPSHACHSPGLLFSLFSLHILLCFLSLSVFLHCVNPSVGRSPFLSPFSLARSLLSLRLVSFSSTLTPLRSITCAATPPPARPPAPCDQSSSLWSRGTSCTQHRPVVNQREAHADFIKRFFIAFVDNRLLYVDCSKDGRAKRL